MTKKKLLCLALCVSTMFASLTGCSSTSTESKTNDADAKKVVTTALENLKTLDKTYEVSNVMQAPDGNLCYVEICSDGVSYAEYPVDADGNYGTVAFQSSDDVDYVLTDWITKDGKGYMLSGEDSWVSYPDSYASELKNRNIMYFDTIVNKMNSLKFKETITADIGMGDEEVNVYTAKLDSDTVHSILGLGSEKIYSSVKSTTKDDSIKKLCEYYLDEIGFTMVFSEANITIGVVDDMLRYVQIETGGLGSRLYSTKSIMLSDVDVRHEPDFSNVDTYESTLKDMADYVSKYDSYEDAMKALNGSSSSTSDLTSEKTTESSTESSTKSTTETESK